MILRYVFQVEVAWSHGDYCFEINIYRTICRNYSWLL